MRLVSVGLTVTLLHETTVRTDRLGGQGPRAHDRTIDGG
jgi:hypothetical protein